MGKEVDYKKAGEIRGKWDREMFKARDSSLVSYCLDEAINDETPLMNAYEQLRASM